MIILRSIFGCTLAWGGWVVILIIFTGQKCKPGNAMSTEKSLESLRTRIDTAATRCWRASVLFYSSLLISLITGNGRNIHIWFSPSLSHSLPLPFSFPDQSIILVGRTLQKGHYAEPGARRWRSLQYLRRRSSAQFTSLQFKMVSMRSGRPICAPPRLSGDSPNVALETVPMLVWFTMALSRPLKLKQFQCWSDSRWPCLVVLSRKSVERFLFLRLFSLSRKVFLRWKTNVKLS